MSLSCSLAHFFRIHCQEEEEEKTDFLKKRSQKQMQKLVTKKMSSTGIQEVGVSQTLNPLFKKINKVFIKY